jgi:hypothetical protein
MNRPKRRKKVPLLVLEAEHLKQLAAPAQPEVPKSDAETQRDAKLLSLMHREMNAGHWRFEAEALCQQLNCSLEELLAAFDRLLRAGRVSAVGPHPAKTWLR